MRALCIAALAACLALVGCGTDFRPPRLVLTGNPAGPVGQSLDLEVSLPHLQVTGAARRGVELDVLVEMERTGFGEIPARLSFGPARVDDRFAVVEDLTAGRATVVVTDDRWFSGRIGPLRIDGTVFEFFVDGTPIDGGWSVEGRSWESLSGLYATFRGWRRHRFLVAGTDFLSSAGRVSEVALVKEREVRVRTGLQLVSSDPVLRVTGSAVFAVNRFSFDNLQRLDPFDDFGTVWQASVGSGANPHDALAAAGKLYVTRYEPPYDDVAVLDLATGASVGAVSLAGLAANPDGTPRPDRMRAAAGLLFVGLQDVDRTFTRFEQGRLAVIDPMIDEVVGTIPLGGKNPGTIDVLRGADGDERLYVALAGVFGGLVPQELSGGVAVVHAATRAFERLGLDDDAEGVEGNVSALAMASERLGYVAVSGADPANRVVAFDPQTGTALRTVHQSFELIPELEIDGGGVLAVPERRAFGSRLCLYRVPADPAVPESAIHCAVLDLPPFSVEALDGSP